MEAHSMPNSLEHENVWCAANLEHLLFFVLPLPQARRQGHAARRAPTVRQLRCRMYHMCFIGMYPTVVLDKVTFGNTNYTAPFRRQKDEQLCCHGISTYGGYLGKNL